MAEPRDLDDLADTIGDDVDEALSTDDEERRRELLGALAITAFALAYAQAGGQGPATAQARDFAAGLRPAFALLQPDGSDNQRQLMRHVIAHAALNAATEAATDDDTKLAWRTMRDDAVRDLHRPLDGQIRAAGERFDVGGHLLAYPGQPVGPPEIWMNCRCLLVPADSVTAASPTPQRGTVVVARPADPDSLAMPGGLPPDDLHVTIGYYGDADTLDPDVGRLLEHFVTHRPLSAEAVVAGRGTIGFDDPPATVLLLEHPELGAVRATLEQIAEPDRTHPHFTPHITLGYGVELPASIPTSVPLNRLELWRGDQRIGADMDEITAASDTPWSKFSASDYTIEQWRRACLLKMPDGDPDSKSTYKLPVREPSGALNRGGVHAAAAALAGARGGVDAPASAKSVARSKLRGLYKQLGEEPPDSLKADALEAWAPSTSPPGTHDAPGWVTHPRETQRLRTYWTKGAGAAKIRWGSPGDLTRCHNQLAKYVPAQHLWSTCQNMHKEALGYWNPQSGRRADAAASEFDDLITAAFVAAATLEDAMLPPHRFFTDPGLTAATPLTVTDDDEVIAHLATWETCHVGISGGCTTPPRSKFDYAYFRTGEVDTDEGPVPVGQITIDTGHAGPDAGPNAAVSHYDDTGTVIADVSAGEDDIGIWLHGMLRPGIPDDKRQALRAAALSGDWRRIGGNLELVAALAVNVPGFPIPRVEMSASAGRELSLVAAGVVTADPNALDVDRIAVSIVKALDDRDATRARQLRAAALADSVRHQRVERLLDVIG